MTLAYPIIDGTEKDKKRDRRLRLSIAALGLVNTVFISCGPRQMLPGLAANLTSVLVNFAILLFPQYLCGFAFKLFADTLFTLGLAAWFGVGNAILSGAISPWRYKSSNVVIGTWSTLITLVMLFLTAALCLKGLKGLSIRIRKYAAASKKPKPNHSINTGCVQCPHCRANNEILTARDDVSPPVQQGSTLFSGIRRWAAGYAPIPAGEEYRDEMQEDGKIRLSEDVDDDAQMRPSLDEVSPTPEGVQTPQNGQQQQRGSPVGKGRDEEEGF